MGSIVLELQNEIDSPLPMRYALHIPTTAVKD